MRSRTPPRIGFGSNHWDYSIAGKIGFDAFLIVKLVVQSVTTTLDLLYHGNFECTEYFSSTKRSEYL
jgi:hypothetical protein